MHLRTQSLCIQQYKSIIFFKWSLAFEHSYTLYQSYMQLLQCMKKKSVTFRPLFWSYRSKKYQKTISSMPCLQACMCAKLLQLCPTLCDPTDYSQPGFSVQEILQARILESVSMPSSGDLPNPGFELTSLISPALAGRFFITSTTWEASSRQDCITTTWEGDGTPLQYSCLENPMDGGA